jgi:4a-hydroxytetrahydrobiopterin dehydratase
MKNFTELNNKLYAKIIFKDFVEAFAFISKLAIVSEKANHHATIHNTYNVVELYLSTHDAGNTITKKDWDLAEQIEALLE